MANSVEWQGDKYIIVAFTWRTEGEQELRMNSRPPRRETTPDLRVSVITTPQWSAN